MASIAVLALGLWIFGGPWLNPTTAALVAFIVPFMAISLSVVAAQPESNPD